MPRSDIVLSKKQADAMLKSERRRLVTSEHEVAVAKLVFDLRAEEFQSMAEARLAFEARHPWLTDAEAEMPEELMGGIPGAEPPYVAVQKTWLNLCARGDTISEQLFKAPGVLQGAMLKQADYEIRAGQMVSAASASAFASQVAAVATNYIEDGASIKRFQTEVLRLHAEFIAANPHLKV